MTALEKAKLAAAKLNADEQAELFRWWVESDAFKQRQLESLKVDVERGLLEFEQGRYQTYSAAQVLQLAEEVGESGRRKLARRNSPKQ